MAYTYTWLDSEHTALARTNESGESATVPTDPRNSDYAEFLDSGATAAEYVAPPTPPEPTTEEKVANMLSAYGLSLAEFQAVLLAD